MSSRSDRAGWRTAVAGTALALVAGALAFTAPGAWAKAAPNTKFCDAVLNMSNDIESGPDVSDASSLRSTAKALKNAAKSAPSKVKSAMNHIADFWSNLAGASKAEALTKLATGAKTYAKDVKKYVSYLNSNC